MPQLRLSLLGGFQAHLADSPVVGFTSDKARALLVYLAAEVDRPHSRSRLAGLFWPNVEENRARAYLRHALANLRQILGDAGAALVGEQPFLLATPQTLQFNQQSHHRLDVADLLAALDTLPAQDRNPLSSDHLARLQAAVAGGERPFLDGFSLGDCPAFEEWLLLNRERVQRRVLAALHHLAEGYEQRGELARACTFARQCIALEPWREESHRQVMHLLAQSGQRSAALAQFESCRRLLRAELGVEPGSETAALHRAILSGEFDEAPRPATTARASSPPRHNLPTQTTPLIGRENELAALADLLSDPAQRLVTIVGPGGIGKTRLALAAAQTALDNFADGVFLVDLTPLHSTADLPRAIGESVGYPFQQESRPLRQQISDYLARRQILLLLDNFEHLLDGADFTVELLQAAPGLCLLVTSRERLHLQSERLLRLAGLAYPMQETEPTGNAYSAITLFVQCVRRLRREYRPEREELTAIARICKQVDGMPLGILLAAGWSDLLTPQEIAGEIAQGVGLLQVELGDLAPRHRNIATVFEQSWQRLSGDEQQALMALSICVGGFDREAAQSIAGASLPLLTRLVDKSLLWRVRDGRYTLHELVRQLSGQKLQSTNESAARRAHSAYYLAEAATHGAQLAGPRYAQILERLGEEEGNIQIAWRWAVEHKESALLQKAAAGVADFYNQPGRGHEGAALLGLAEEMLADEAGAGDQKLHGFLLAWQGVLLRNAGKIQAGEAGLRRSIEKLTALQEAGEETRRERAFALRQIGLEYVGPNQTQLIEECAESLRLCREIGDLPGTAEALQILGHMYATSINNRAAQTFLEESLRIRRHLEDPMGLFKTLDRLSFVHHSQAHFDKSMELSKECLATVTKYGIPLPPAGTRLPHALMSVGRLEEAEAAAKQTIHRLLGLGIRANQLTWVLNWLGRIYIHQGKYSAAREQSGQASALFEELRGWKHPFFLRTIGNAALAEGAYSEAAELLVTGSRDSENPLAAYTAVDQVYLALATGDLAQARIRLSTSMARILEKDEFYLAVRALPACALLFARQGELERAAEIFAFARSYPYVANSRWFYDVAGKQVERLLAPLPATIRATAEKRGRARELPQFSAELMGLL